MRVTGGSAKGHKLLSPKSGCRFIRPTGDRVREALFNMLAEEIPDSLVLDLYAGTGALGIEALSRGAEAVVFIDRSKQALELIHRNVRACFPAAKASLVQLDLSRSDSMDQLQKKIPLQFDLILLDPPYEKKLADSTLQMVERGTVLKTDGLVAAEERKSEQLAAQYGTLTLIRSRKYGETGIWLYRNLIPAETDQIEAEQ
ncbi:MAG: 16S rRNA (guanine(966)-N(2))-methyltransferase RsmD [Candidatus Electrothrix sp. YB6]